MGLPAQPSLVVPGLGLRVRGLITDYDGTLLYSRLPYRRAARLTAEALNVPFHPGQLERYLNERAFYEQIFREKLGINALHEAWMVLRTKTDEGVAASGLGGDPSQTLLQALAGLHPGTTGAKTWTELMEKAEFVARGLAEFKPPPTLDAESRRSVINHPMAVPLTAEIIVGILLNDQIHELARGGDLLQTHTERELARAPANMSVVDLAYRSAIAGIPRLVLSGNGAANVEAGIRGHAGFDQLFPQIVALNDPSAKLEGRPQDAELTAAAERLGIDPGDILFLGDQLADVMNAGRAGMPCAWAPAMDAGYGSRISGGRLLDVADWHAALEVAARPDEPETDDVVEPRRTLDEFRGIAQVNPTCITDSYRAGWMLGSQPFRPAIGSKRRFMSQGHITGRTTRLSPR